MDDYEKELRNYRIRKRREQTVRNIKSSIQKIFMPARMDQTEKIEEIPENIDATAKQQESEKSKKCIVTDTIDNLNVESNSDNNYASPMDCENNEPEAVHIITKDDSKIYTYILRVVGTMFWLTIFLITIELGFGIVFLLFSALLGIYFNTSTKPKKPDEPSAYSVFNKNCESIEGTLKAEQFEREFGILR